MKRFLVFLLAAVFVMAAGNAFAGPPTESSVKYMDTLGVWHDNPVDVEGRDARLWRTGEEFAGNCNKTYWSHNVLITASIAQWIDFHLTYTQFDWYIRKPGTYAGDCIDACVASNGDIFIDYAGFADLQPSNPANNPIPVWYSLETSGGWAEVNAGWVPASAMDAEDDWLYDADLGELLHTGICWKLWNKIEVLVCNSACEYSDEATITLTLWNQKDWIVDATGAWGTLPPPPP